MISRSSGFQPIPVERIRATRANKVPEVTIIFWFIKILSTTVGETGADYLAVHAGWGAALTAACMSALLLIALTFQFLAKRCIPYLYWLTVVLVSIVGTQLTDTLTDRLDVSLYLSTAIFACGLIAVFAIWYLKEGTLSIRSITSRRREAFYWAAILLTFALGTAAGDLATEALGLGFSYGTLVFSVAILGIILAYNAGLNAVLSFWVAYILTRPLGASLGDLLSQSREYGGVGLGTIKTSLVFLLAIAALVAYLTRQDLQRNFADNLRRDT